MRVEYLTKKGNENFKLIKYNGKEYEKFVSYNFKFKPTRIEFEYKYNTDSILYKFIYETDSECSIIQSYSKNITNLFQNYKTKQKNCDICYLDKKWFVTMHDKHSVCSDCYDKLKYDPCPFCRQRITQCLLTCSLI